MVEQLIRNQQVSGSIPLAGSTKQKDFPVKGRKILFVFKDSTSKQYSKKVPSFSMVKRICR